jgi:hypothetical protein
MAAARILCLAVVCCLALAACNHEPTFDASSVPAYQKSLAKIKPLLSPKDQYRLQVALLTLAAGGPTRFTAFTLSDPATTDAYEALDDVFNSLIMLAQMRPSIAGKTAGEVIRRVADDLDFAIAQAETGTGRAEKDLAAIVIENTTYRLDHNGRSAPTGEFSVYNGSRVPIVRLYLTAELTTRDVKMPLVLNNIICFFSRPLQPGVQQQAKVYLGITGSNSTTKPFLTADDADLTLKVANVEDADGRKLLALDAQVLGALRRKRDLLRGS